jgi:hypothetical protein
LQCLVACFLLICLSKVAMPLQAQSSDEQMVSPSRAQLSADSSREQSTQLPDAPRAAGEEASVSGTVLDASGAAVPSAQVTLTQVGESQGRSLETGTDGRFSFKDVHSGSYFILVQAKGFQPSPSAKFRVAATQAYEIPSVKLSIAAVTTEVVVQPAEVIAAQQIKAEERQRLDRIIPDFYTSYVWNAAPLDTTQKYSLALRDTVDPFSFVGVSIGAGIEQAKNAFSGYGQGAQGYAKRWGALFANGRTSDLLGRAVFPSLFHQDPRYFYQGSGSTWSRAKHAVGYAFVARSDSGHLMPNYSYLLGDLCSGGISNLYYPAPSRSASLVFTNAAIGIAGRAGQNLLREFLLQRITKHVPGNGKPASTGGNP